MSGSLLPMGKKEEEEEDLLTNKPLPRAVEREGELGSTVTCLSVEGNCSWFFLSLPRHHDDAGGSNDK